jgi:tetratricopeptide (TPR) repeat protein
VADLTEALRLDPDLRVAYVNRAFAQAALGRDDLAVADLRAAAERFPDWSVAWRKLAEFLTERGRRAEAVEALGQAIAARPGDAPRWAERAALLAEAGERDRAIADYGEALRLEPRRSDWLKARAGLHAARGDHAAALADLDAAVTLTPRYAPAHRERARVLRALGREAEARDAEAQAEAARDWPSGPEFALFMALGLLLNGIRAAAGLAAGLLVRRASIGAALAGAIGAIEAAWPVLDVLLAFDSFSLLTMALGAAGALAWWAVGRVLRRVLGGRPPAVAAGI